MVKKTLVVCFTLIGLAIFLVFGFAAVVGIHEGIEQLHAEGDPVCQEAAARVVAFRHVRQEITRQHNRDFAAYEATPTRKLGAGLLGFLQRNDQAVEKLKALILAQDSYIPTIPDRCRRYGQARLDADAAADPDVKDYGPAPGPPIQRCSDGRFSDHCGG